MNNIKNRIDFLLEKKIENAQYELISTDQDAGVDDLLDVVNQIKKEYGQNSISIIDKSGHKSGNFISVYVDINLAEWKKTKEGLKSDPITGAKAVRLINNIATSLKAKLVAI